MRTGWRKLVCVCSDCGRGQVVFASARVQRSVQEKRRRCPVCKKKGTLDSLEGEPRKAWLRKRLDQKLNARHRRQDYLSYIASSPEWQERRKQIIQRDQGKCRLCKQDGNHVHHITYANLFREPLEDLVLLCRSCHNQEHKTHELQDREGFWFAQLHAKTPKRSRLNVGPLVWEPEATTRVRSIVATPAPKDRKGDRLHARVS